MALIYAGQISAAESHAGRLANFAQVQRLPSVRAIARMFEARIALARGERERFFLLADDDPLDHRIMRLKLEDALARADVATALQLLTKLEGASVEVDPGIELAAKTCVLL